MGTQKKKPWEVKKINNNLIELMTKILLAFRFLVIIRMKYKRLISRVKFMFVIFLSFNFSCTKMLFFLLLCLPSFHTLCPSTNTQNKLFFLFCRISTTACTRNKSIHFKVKYK